VSQTYIRAQHNSKMVSSLTIAPIKVARGDLEYKLPIRPYLSWTRLSAPLVERSATSTVSNLVFDNGISISQADSSWFRRTCMVKWKPINITITTQHVPGSNSPQTRKDSDKPGMHYIVEFDVAEMLERTFSSSHARDFPLANGADRFTAVRLHLHPSDSDNERLAARPDVVISQLKYLARNEAGQVAQADWSRLFGPSLATLSPERNCESSSPSD